MRFTVGDLGFILGSAFRFKAQVESIWFRDQDLGFGMWSGV